MIWTTRLDECSSRSDGWVAYHFMECGRANEAGGACEYEMHNGEVVTTLLIKADPQDTVMTEILPVLDGKGAGPLSSLSVLILVYSLELSFRSLMLLPRIENDRRLTHVLSHARQIHVSSLLS